jgi:hypothetical protein
VKFSFRPGPLIFAVGIWAAASSYVYAECGRDCLEGHLENYLQALAARDLSRIQTTDDVVFIENNEVLELGEGSWRTFTGLGTYRHYFADPVTQQVAVISTMRENGRGVIYDLRLKLADEKIAEIESLVIRDHRSVKRYEETLATPPENFMQTIPLEERVSRADLVATANKYLEGMENNQPNIGYPFFDKECNRIEHATKTTNNKPQEYGHSTNREFVTLTCEEQFNTGFLGFVTRIRDRRYVIIDEERQTVFGLVILDHNGTIRDIPLGNGGNFHVPPYFSTPRSLLVGEAWRVRNNKLLELEMTLTEIPYGSRTKFNPDDGAWARSTNLNPANRRVPGNCDKNCLEQWVQAVTQAFVSRDVNDLPLSPDLRYTENGQELAVGDGLWGTATAINSVQAILSDPVGKQAGLVANITETDVEGLLSLRLKIDDNLIKEIEVVMLRQEKLDARGGTVTLQGPQIEGQYDPEKYGTLAETFSAEVKPGKADNIVHATDEFAGAARAKRLWLADAGQGLALQQLIRDDSNVNAGEDSITSGAYSVMSMNLHKISGDKITATQTVSRSVPYKMRSGW